MSSKAKEAYERLVRGVEDLVRSDSWKEYLSFQSRFYDYSFNNTLLIWLQCPHASHVAGYRSWKELGRFVKRGEKAIKILAPLTYKNELTDEEGNEVVKRFIRGFRTVNVFEVSQTDGEELPRVCTPLEGDSEEAKKVFEALNKFIDIGISEEEIAGGAHGYHDVREDRIALEIKNALNHKAKILTHEYVHSLLDKEGTKENETRREAEVVAESAAFIVSDYFGLDTSSYSFGYVAGWSGADPKEILKKGELIQKTAAKIISEVEEEKKKDSRVA